MIRQKETRQKKRKEAKEKLSELSLDKPRQDRGSASNQSSGVVVWFSRQREKS